MGQCLEIDVPGVNSRLTMGAFPNGEGGMSATTDGTVLMDCKSAMSLQSKGGMTVQTNAAMVIAADGGLTMGSPVGVEMTAGGDAMVFAGAGVAAGGCGKGKPAAPTKKGKPPEVPAVDPTKIKNEVAQKNAVNKMVKAGADLAALPEKVKNWQDAKGTNPLEKAGNAAEALGIVADGESAPINGVSGLDELGGGGQSEYAKTASSKLGSASKTAQGAKKFADSAKNNDLLGTFLGAKDMFDNGKGLLPADDKKLGGAPSGGEGAEANGAEGAGASGPGGGPGGGGNVDMRAPVDIKSNAGVNIDGRAGSDVKFSAGANLLETAGGNAELTAGGNISQTAGGSVSVSAGGSFSLTAAGAVSSTSAAFSVFAVSAASIKGLGSASLSSAATTKIEAGGAVSIKSGGPNSITASKVSVTAASVTMTTAKLDVSGALTVGKVAVFKNNVVCSQNGAFKGELKSGEALKGSNLKVKSTIKGKNLSA